MYFSEIINLIAHTVNQNAIGDSVESPTKQQIFADKQSIRQSEFYQAAVSGLRPEIMFVVRTSDYNQEPRIEYPIDSGKEYKIIRTYDKDGEFTELICQGVVNGVR